MPSLQSLIAGLGRLVPQRLKQAVLGRPGAPSKFANAIHSVLNAVPGPQFTILRCGGVLEDYRMKLDWQKHRSLVYGNWEPEVVEAIVREVEPGGFVLDIGAHIGFYSLLLSKKVGPHGRVVAFEPFPANFDVLEENLRLNQCKQVLAVKKAVMDCSCELKVSVPAGEPLPGVFSVVGSEGADQVLIEAVSLDDFLSTNGLPVAFIKIDVEGAEEQVLRGAKKTLASFHPTVLLEVHHGPFPPEQHPAIALLSAQDYSLTWIDRLDYTSHVLAKWKESVCKGES